MFHKTDSVRDETGNQLVIVSDGREGGEMKKVPIPTDKELNEAIKDLKLQLAILENMLKLNAEGREKVVIYMFGLLNFDEFRR